MNICCGITQLHYHLDLKVDMNLLAPYAMVHANTKQHAMMIGS